MDEEYKLAVIFPSGTVVRKGGLEARKVAVVTIDPATGRRLSTASSAGTEFDVCNVIRGNRSVCFCPVVGKSVDPSRSKEFCLAGSLGKVDGCNALSYSSGAGCFEERKARKQNTSNCG